MLPTFRGLGRRFSNSVKILLKGNPLESPPPMEPSAPRTFLQEARGLRKEFESFEQRSAGSRLGVFVSWLIEKPEEIPMLFWGAPYHYVKTKEKEKSENPVLIIKALTTLFVAQSGHSCFCSEVEIRCSGSWSGRGPVTRLGP